MTGLSEALKFIIETRKNEKIKDQINMLENKAELIDLEIIGRDSGYNFTVEDLRTAFKHDWNMRWHRLSLEKNI
jgi:hypothetical protein